MDVKIWTVREIMNWSIMFLKQAGSDTPRLDTELLLCDVMSCRRLDLYLDHDKPLTAMERERYRNSLKRRSQLEPVAYIVGKKDFFSLSFKVNQNVLVPRPETELLVEIILKNYPDDVPAFGLDIGTGSGYSYRT